jgi:hypothetical protein
MTGTGCCQLAARSNYLPVCWPGIFLGVGEIDDTTDFRDVYATLLDGVLRTEPGKVLSGWSGRIDGLLA